MQMVLNMSFEPPLCYPLSLVFKWFNTKENKGGRL